MRKLFTLLIGILTILPAAHAKDYTWECLYRTRQCLSSELGISTHDDGADAKIAQAFLDHYYRSDIKHDISINNDGDVLFDGVAMSVSKAKGRIDALKTRGKQTIVLLITNGYQMKSNKALDKLMKSVYQLIEYRDKEGIACNVYPVLCTDRSMGNKVRDLMKVPPPSPSMLPIAETIEPETPTESQPATNHTSKTTASQSKDSGRDAVPEDVPKQDAEVPLTPALGDYVVCVETFLSIRATPAANGKKIGTLTNGHHVDVVEISDGWAKIWYNDQACYVSADYLKPVESSNGGSNDSSLDFMHMIYEALYKFMPYVILLFAILLYFMMENHIMPLAFLLGLAELLFAAGNSAVGTGALPWFCNPSDVGWIMTIINFILLLGVLILQHTTYQTIMREFRLGWFGYALSYPVMAFVGIALCSCLVDISYFWAPIVAIGFVWVVLKWRLGHDALGTLRVSLWASISFGGLLVFFLQTAGVLILGGIIWILFRAVTEGKSSSSSSYDSEQDHSSGMVERSADGTEHVRHSDGSTTPLRDVGGGVTVDDQGRPYHKSVDGRHASRS